LLRLIRATTQRDAGSDAVFMGDYRRCLADCANLLTLEREAPQLPRLYALLLPDGAGAAERKQALKHAFLAGGRRPPRLWPTMCRLSAALTAREEHVGMPSLTDRVDLLQALDLPCQPPDGRLFGLRQSFGSRALLHDETEAATAHGLDAFMGLPRHSPRAARIELQRLLTSYALYEEGRFLENCVRDRRAQLVDGTATIYSVHLARTGEHIGTAAVSVDDGIEARGRANARLSTEHRRETTAPLLREHARLWGTTQYGRPAAAPPPPNPSSASSAVPMFPGEGSVRAQQAPSRSAARQAFRTFFIPPMKTAPESAVSY